ncbi:MAG: hypothetical protein J0H06_05965 [Actinobacteria bacterium]|nr:hypothetical protein [Actinomycetota bacterium]OJU85286.1 MAG: hypothetical protein BGO11_17250 [Solirubrobacterales bacterium 70-9]
MAGASRRRPAYRWAAIAAGVPVIAVLAACGGSSKPAYCADRAGLEESVKELPGFVTSADLSGLRTQAETVEEAAGTLVESAKADFPSQTEAIDSSVRSLRGAVAALPPEPTPTQFAQVGVEAATVVSAVRGFSRATESECG